MKGALFILAALAGLWLLTALNRPSQPLVIDGLLTMSGTDDSLDRPHAVSSQAPSCPRRSPPPPQGMAPIPVQPSDAWRIA